MTLRHLGQHNGHSRSVLHSGVPHTETELALGLRETILQGENTRPPSLLFLPGKRLVPVTYTSINPVRVLGFLSISLIDQEEGLERYSGYNMLLSVESV